jgi:pimeloyl-ACP methyl ester carboxylesterase
LDVDPAVGLILYPGGRVDPRAYAPPARAIAAGGYLVVIVPMPLNLAVFGPNRAAEVMDTFPGIELWAIGGHSLGGAMAARFAYRQSSAVHGLVLWASYPAASDDLSARELAVVSIYGTRDGLATGEKIAASRPLLPAETCWVAIVGGNHAQFGWYGPQSADNPATISREAQQQEVIAATLALLTDLEGL